MLDWLLQHAPEVTTVSLVLAVVSILFALLQARKARQIAVQLGEIADSLSTRVIGGFDDYMPELIELVKNAKIDLHIGCTITTTGCFTGPTSARELIRALEDKGPSFSLNVICATPELRNRFDATQFRLEEPAEFANLLRTNRVQLQTFLDFWSNDLPRSDITEPDHFAECLQALHNLSVKVCKATPCDSEFTMWYWIADQEEAIVVLPYPSTILKAVAMRTRDSGLIHALINLFHYQCSKRPTDSSTTNS